MKKKLAYLAVAALSVSMLVGCGSESGSKKGAKVDVELSEVLENAADAVTEIKSIDLGVKAEADMTGSAQGMNMSIKGSAELSGKAQVDDPAVEGSAKVSYKMTGAGQDMEYDNSAQIYGETEDDEMHLYVRVNDEDWQTDTMDVSGVDEYVTQLEDIVEQVKSGLGSLSSDDLKEVEDFVKLESKTSFVNKKECYVLSAKIDKDKLLKMYEEGEDYLEDMEQYKEVFEQLDSMNINYALYFAKADYMPVKFEMNISGKGNVEGVDVNIKKIHLEINLGVNDAKVSPVPENVKESAVETDLGLGGGYDDYDWDDDDWDYDYEDDDYDYDDYEADDED